MGRRVGSAGDDNNAFEFQKSTDMTNSDDLTPPASEPSDLAHAAAIALVGQIPIVGAAAAVIVGYLVSSPLERRRTKWTEDVANAIREIRAKQGRTIDDLRNDERFIDAVMQATQIAIRTSQEEKLAALKYAIVNVAASNSLDQSVEHMFLCWIDDLSAWHLRLLRLLSDPKGWFRESGQPVPEHHITSSIIGLIGESLPVLSGQRELCQQVVRDLNNRGLSGIDDRNLFTAMSADGAYRKHTTSLGDQFLQFVSSPK